MPNSNFMTSIFLPLTIYFMCLIITHHGYIYNNLPYFLHVTPSFQCISHPYYHMNSSFLLTSVYLPLKIHHSCSLIHSSTDHLHNDQQTYRNMDNTKILQLSHKKSPNFLLAFWYTLSRIRSSHHCCICRCYTQNYLQILLFLLQNAISLHLNFLFFFNSISLALYPFTSMLFLISFLFIIVGFLSTYHIFTIIASSIFVLL